MPLTIKQLNLTDLILSRRGTFTFRLIVGAFGIALRLFFRRIETVNAGVVPEGAGVIFVLNHPNGLIDPALIFVALPRKISFLAKSTLFRMPVISFLLRTVEALPLYRRIDAGEDVSKNKKTFELCRAILQKGGSIALFPEGVSHNSPKLLPAKTGAARIALGTVSLPSASKLIDLEIVPVGLFYTNKTTFRSEALLHFGEPFKVESVVLDEDGQPPREAVKALTRKIEDVLREITLNAESEAELHTANIAERIFASTADNTNLAEKLDFLKNYVVGTKTEESKLENTRFEDLLHTFDTKLDRFGLGPEHLSLAQFSRASVTKQALIQIWPLALLSPLAIAGAVIHYPAYRLCGFFANLYARLDAEDIASTVKVLAGMVLMPLTWIILATGLYFYFGWQIALASIPFSFLCGYAALYTLEEIEELRGWAKAIWLFLTKREKFLRLYVERGDLLEELRSFD